MKKRILLPTDFSKNAMNAISYALDLYTQDSCDFYVLNTYTIEPYTMEMNALSTMEESKKNSTIKLSRLLKHLQKKTCNANHNFHMISECSALLDAMQELINSYDIDMVIMGTKGDTDSRTEVYGSQTVLAIEKLTACPILAVPAGASFNGINAIVFPTGYHTPYKRREFQYLIDIAEKTNATINIFHVVDGSKGLSKSQLQKQELLRGYFEHIKYKFHKVEASNVQKALDSFIEEFDCDMVVFINKKHNFLRWVLSKPMVKQLTYYSTVPILALHDNS
ncbi:universal stress protein [Winogradskyella sp. DF17]|uniref:Universal stress protein n=1 Tax=Winogradskyella pelagia TaxID=2819984 RepID=A0ABS3T2K3_9FLAO|nr:universal stress protein [Winogradskyella sp. DF17]MBO3116976.1 universal stress protein [Winogradskyella sp. DF17]